MTHGISHYRMLVVDDEPNILRALRRLFRNDPVDLMSAESAEEALQKVRKYRIHVLLTDNKMPGMDGTELVRTVKAISPDTIRIMISGQSDLSAVLSAVNDGEIFRFIQKPWSDVDLKITVNLALAHCRLTDENKRMKERLEEVEVLIKMLESQYPQVYDHLQSMYKNAIDQAVRDSGRIQLPCTE